MAHCIFPQKMHACWFHVRLSVQICYAENASSIEISLIISTWRESKSNILNYIHPQRTLCLPESSMSHSDSSPFLPQAPLSPKAVEHDEVQLVRIYYLLAKYSHLWQSCQIFVPKPNEHTNWFFSLQTGGQCFKSTFRNSWSGSVPAKAKREGNSSSVIYETLNKGVVSS